MPSSESVVSPMNRIAFQKRRFSRRRMLGSCLTLGAFVLPRRAGAWPESRSAPAKGLILLLLEGGMSHLESWDPKPEAPAEVRGEFGSIATSVPELRVGEHMPLLAQQAHLYNVIRSVHCDARNDHSPGMHILLTGWENTAAGVAMERSNFHHPSQGSILAHQLGVTSQGGMPRFIAVPRQTQISDQVRFASASFLGMSYEAFDSGEPAASGGQPSTLVPGLSLVDDVPLRRLDDRRALRESINQLQVALDRSEVLDGMDVRFGQAYEVLAGQGMSRALAISEESDQVRERYGNHAVGQSLLLARRLVEAGATYVLADPYRSTTWDFHSGNFTGHKQHLPAMDQAVSALLADLDERGLLDDVLVLVAGEMGRTPAINKDAGRDHWTSAYSVMLAGGGLTRGQVLGSTTSKGEWPRQRPVTVTEILATLYHRLGVDPNTLLRDSQDRPVPILPCTEYVPELIA